MKSPLACIRIMLRTDQDKNQREKWLKNVARLMKHTIDYMEHNESTTSENWFGDRKYNISKWNVVPNAA